VQSDHPPGLADVNLVRPVAVIGELVLGQAPAAHRFADIGRHPRVVGDEVVPALLVAPVLIQDLAAALVCRLGIIVVQADVVGAERTVVVGVGLEIWDRVELVKGLAPAGGKDSQQ
jgi:hypothetical protein